MTVWLTGRAQPLDPDRVRDRGSRATAGWLGAMSVGARRGARFQTRPVAGGTRDVVGSSRHRRTADGALPVINAMLIRTSAARPIAPATRMPGRNHTRNSSGSGRTGPHS
jgi:hypothetical protein